MVRQWFAFLVSLVCIAGATGQVDVGGIVDSDRCNSALSMAAGADGLVNSTEYVTFVQLFGPPGFAADVMSFLDLPLALRGAFFSLACLCTESADCCVGANANIDATGTRVSNPTDAQIFYLFTVCVTVDSAIQTVLGTVAPSTMSPTFAPSLSPTPGPTTAVPTIMASGAPTIVGSDGPSVSPSVSPTTAPTLVGSDIPSASPTVTPTTAPVTPAPATPAPITPAPVTQAPITPAPITPAPATPAPATPAPATPAPVTPAPATPAPVTPAPATPAPVTPAPVTPAPVAPVAPVTPAPIAPVAPVTPAPVAPVAPVTPAPVAPTMAPVTPAPVAPTAPVTPAPTMAPVTPAPVAPVAPVTPAPTMVPVTPAPVAPVAPVSPAPVAPSMAPVTPAPVAPVAPVTPAPTMAPVTPAPVAPVAPVTPAPVAPTMAPVTPAPVAPVAPVTPAPTMAPVTPAPVAPVAPVTPAPVAPTMAPVTPAPVAPVAPVTPAPVAPAAPVTPAPVAPPPVDVVATTTYDISIANGMTAIPSTRDQELTLAMDDLAGQVVTEVFPAPAGRRRRRLVVTLTPPSTVGGGLNITCPSDIPSTDLCQSVPARITLAAQGEDPAQVAVNFTSALNQAIISGRLQTALTRTSPNSQIILLTGRTIVPSPSPPTGSTGFSVATTGVIIAGGVVAVLAFLAMFVFRGFGRETKNEDETYFPTPAEEEGGGDGSQGTREIFVPASSGKISTGSSGQLGATQADYGKKGKKSGPAVQSLEEGDAADAGPTPEAVESADSSNAGDSGWSSSLGQSSTHTGSVDSLDFGGPGGQAAGASLAAIGATSAIAADSSEREAVPDVPHVTREDLDQAIEAGDWAAVGATAALLAAASDSQSQSSRSRRSGTSYSRDGTSISSLDAARAAELDHLVDAGDWEGVVLAAAKFEASEDTSTNASQTFESSHNTGTTGSHSTSLSESPSKIAKRDEIREEVEALVRRVVPEEIDNVDEMMLQFKGREEELVETLRTMQERQIAQIARVQGQKQAKRDARRTAQQGGIELPRPGAPAGQEVNDSTAAGIGLGVAAAAGVAAGVAAAQGDDDASDLSDDRSDDPGVKEREPPATEEGDPKRQRTELELAIEAGDWEAVGAAAAMLSDASVTSGSSLGGDGSSTGGDSANRGYRIDADRAAQLDAMIDRGDWTGVVAAASRFTGSAQTEEGGTGPSTLTAESSSRAATAGTTETTSLEADPDQRLQEEQEALAQAEIWMTIAEQSKQEGTTDAGASDAADWAIARSLSALRQAEEAGDLQRRQSEEVSGASSTGEEGSQDRSV